MLFPADIVAMSVLILAPFIHPIVQMRQGRFVVNSLGLRRSCRVTVIIQTRFRDLKKKKKKHVRGKDVKTRKSNVFRLNVVAHKVSSVQKQLDCVAPDAQLVHRQHSSDRNPPTV